MLFSSDLKTDAGNGGRRQDVQGHVDSGAQHCYLSSAPVSKWGIVERAVIL
jgi:hypothetical protein